MDDIKGLKDEASISKVENKRKGKPKGSSKTGGRKPGTPNKKTVWLRDELQNAGINWGQEFKKAYSKDKIDIERLNILLGLLPYLNPKLKESEAPQEAPTETVKTQADILSIVKK